MLDYAEAKLVHPEKGIRLASARSLGREQLPPGAVAVGGHYRVAAGLLRQGEDGLAVSLRKTPGGKA